MASAPEAHFGASVALSGDGSTALVGARGADGGNGAASVFSDTSTGWVEQSPPLVGGAEGGEGFGGSVALSFNGSVAVIGAPDAANHRGNTWLFEREAPPGGGWGVAQEKLGAGLPGRGGVQFGSGVALSADAETVLVGAHSDERSGAAWVFGPSPSVAAVAPDSGSSAGGTHVTITGEHLTGATAVRFGSNSCCAASKVQSSKSITGGISNRGRHGRCHRGNLRWPTAGPTQAIASPTPAAKAVAVAAVAAVAAAVAVNNPPSDLPTTEAPIGAAHAFRTRDGR